jgi:RNA polymerase sigma-70 factor (ECF subfamily)
VVVAAGADSSPAAKRALASLCEQYWYPLYAFARRRGMDAHEAQDRVQEFFATLLEKDYLAQVDRERGRFRSFLVASFRNHVSKERAKERAQKRGGAVAHLSLDFEYGEERYRMEPADDTTPERVYERRWALTLLDRVLAAVRSEFREKGKEPLFDALKPFIAGGSPLPSHAEVAERVGMTPNAAKVAIHRLRRRYRDRLRHEIADTVSDPAAIDDELRHLMDAL